MTVSRAHLILLVDDEPQIVRAVTSILEARGFDVTPALTAREAMDRLMERTPDLIVLDLTLPDEDGLSVLARIRTFSETPVIVLSARGDERDKVDALNGGADDYMTKPFSAGELLARIGALLRRAGGSSGQATLVTGDIVIDFAHRRVTRGGEDVALTPTEYAILEALASNHDCVLTWDEIVDAAWGQDLDADLATLRVHVSNLRRKIEPDPSVPTHLLTVPRVGFRFSTQV